ncbi:hypothetical protein [Streptomyces sp. NPDC058426]|uniref:hypothetical protein n=1 Tax=Streptomyces sp. NPDC058426 TaxID=3346493 RepID=UPI0036589E37
MKITHRSLAESWQRTAASHPLLHGVPFPFLADTEDELDAYAEHAGEEGTGGLCLLLEADGTVRGRVGAYEESFTSRDPGDVLYLVAETAIRERSEDLAEAADTLERIEPEWGRRFRGGGLGAPGALAPCGRDPLDGFAWSARSWRNQDPYTCLAFFRTAPGRPVDAERLALLYGADPAQVAEGTRLRDLRAVDGGRAHDEREWESCAYGQAGGWAYLLHHETPPGAFADTAAYTALGVRESVWLTATMAKAIYTFQYVKDGHVVDDGDLGAMELRAYSYGRAPYRRGGALDFLNRAIRRAEFDHPKVTDPYALYFRALETSLGLTLPRREFTEGTVRTAYWAGG